MRTRQKMKQFLVTNSTDSEHYRCEGNSWTALSCWMYEKLDPTKKWKVTELDVQDD